MEFRLVHSTGQSVAIVGQGQSVQAILIALPKEEQLDPEQSTPAIVVHHPGKILLGVTAAAVWRQVGVFENVS